VSHLSQREKEEELMMFGRRRLPGKGVGGGSTRDLDALREFTQKLVQKEIMQKKSREIKRLQEVSIKSTH
jgi:hypothetical protein